ncbi:MAG: hypothetical protein SFT91_05230, partial [Rickettsiaceae bacterium]|nr:hypothetical protein [Rickettsiaceae bacterium]
VPQVSSELAALLVEQYKYHYGDAGFSLSCENSKINSLNDLLFANRSGLLKDLPQPEEAHYHFNEPTNDQGNLHGWFFSNLVNFFDDWLD